MAQQDTPTAGPLSVRTQDHVCFKNLAGGQTEGGLAEIDLFDVAAKSDVYLMLPRSRQQGSQEIRTMNHDVRGLVDQPRVGHGRRRREHVSSIGAERPGLWSVRVLEDLLQNAPVLEHTRSIG